MSVSAAQFYLLHTALVNFSANARRNLVRTAKAMFAYLSVERGLLKRVGGFQNSLNIVNPGKTKQNYLLNLADALTCVLSSKKRGMPAVLLLTSDNFEIHFFWNCNTLSICLKRNILQVWNNNFERSTFVICACSKKSTYSRCRSSRNRSVPKPRKLITYLQYSNSRVMAQKFLKNYILHAFHLVLKKFKF